MATEIITPFGKGALIVLNGCLSWTDYPVSMAMTGTWNKISVTLRNKGWMGQPEGNLSLIRSLY